MELRLLFEEHKQFYLEHFGEATDVDERRGTYWDHIDEIVEAISTNTPIPRLDAGGTT